MDRSQELERKNIMTFEELAQHKDWKKAVLVISKSSFEHEYDEEERSYVIENTDWFDDENQHELYADCLKSIKDGSKDDTHVLISYYLSREVSPWKIEYCYILS